MKILTIILSLSISTVSALSFDSGQYQNVDPTTRNWFRALRSPQGIPCCDLADGHATTWRKSLVDGFEYEVPIQGEWYGVPPEAIIKNSNNPTGESVVWYVKQAGNTYHIRCFVLGSGV